MKVLIAGGGTGGHVYPGIAIANEIRHRHPDWTIEFAGRHNSLEGRVVPKEGYVIHNLHVAGYERYYNAFEKALVVGRLLVAIKDSFVLLHKVKPDVFIGTGGYICGPIGMAAGIKRIPSLITEQNVIPGFTIKTLSRSASVVCTSFEETAQYVHHPERCVLTGNPVRREFGLFTRELARKSLKLGENQRMVISFGGSLGAKSLNDSVREMILRLCGNPNYVFTHITGEKGYQEFMDGLAEAGFDLKAHQNVRILAYTNEMPMMMNAADLVIARSGAMTISEINYVGIPAVYIPYPYAANDHQMKNAQFAEKSGAALIIADAQLNGQSLTQTVMGLLKNDKLLKEMAVKSSAIGFKNAAALMCDEAEKLAAAKGE